MLMQGSENAGLKRYTCLHCAYSTDRRDLYTRHEYIHREVKPFHCYVCWKPFNRADHVKKHFLRIHPELEYDLTRIRATPPSGESDDGGCGDGGATAQQVLNSSTESACQQNGECDTKSQLKDKSKGGQEHRYTCPYCLWTGVDNWCLKRHMNTHTRPYACSLCEYKAARTERLASHMLKVHNKSQCSRCSFTGDDENALQLHRLQEHGVNSSKAAVCLNRPSPPPADQYEQPIDYSASIEARPVVDPPAFPAPLPISPLRELSQNSILSRSQLEAALNLPRYFVDWWNNRAEQLRMNPYQLECGSRRRLRKQTMPRKVILE